MPGSPSGQMDPASSEDTASSSSHKSGSVSAPAGLRPGRSNRRQKPAGLINKERADQPGAVMGVSIQEEKGVRGSSPSPRPSSPMRHSCLSEPRRSSPFILESPKKVAIY